MDSPRLFVALKNKVASPLPTMEVEGLNLDVLSWFTNNVLHYKELNIPLYQLSPYYLKTEEGYIFENLWQSAKIYPKVTKQFVSYGKTVTWDHPEEVHIKDEQITQSYWKWRQKLLFNPYPVRYPNGYYGRSSCKCALWFDKERREWVSLDYINSRKVIYGKEYIRLIKETEAYKILKQLYDAGVSMQVCEVDVRPSEITKEVLYKELNNKFKACGHSYFLYAALMFSDEEIEEWLRL